MGLVQKENLVFFYIRVPRETERQQRKKMGTQEYLTSNQPWITSRGEKVKGKHPLLYRREKDRPTWKAQQVQRPVLRLEVKFFVYGGQDVKDRHVILDILPCVVITSLETDAFTAIVACADMLVTRNPARGRENKVLKDHLLFWLMVRRNPARGRKVRVLKEQLRFWNKKGPRLYLKIQIQRSLFCGKLGKWDWTLRRDTP